MNKLLILGAAALGAIATGAAAHPTDIPFDSFGACNAALNQVNHDDRDMVAQFFPNTGGAEVDMLGTWSCAYVPELDAWYIQGEIGVTGGLGNGNGKAEPGTNR